MNTCVAVIAADHKQRSTVSSFYFLSSLTTYQYLLLFCRSLLWVFLFSQDKAVFHALTTDAYTLWCRDWTAHSCVTERTLSCINGIKPDGVVLLPRLVGLGSPELGNHFILWVINGTQKNIQIFDSLGIYNTLKTEDRLANASWPTHLGMCLLICPFGTLCYHHSGNRQTALTVVFLSAQQQRR